MRTRFLATDYFSPASAASCSDQALASLRFPPLLVPSLPPDPRLPFPLPFPAAADLPAVSISGDGLDSLPISSALYEFLAAVIPQPLPVPTTLAADEGLDDFLYDRGRYSKGFSSRGSVALKIPDGLDEISREKEGEGAGSISMSDRSGTSTDTKRWELLKEHIFEVAEVDLPQPQDFIDIDTEMTLRYPTELAESIYQVEKIPVKHNCEELVEIHPVTLSNAIRDLMKDIHMSCKSVLHESAYLRQTFSDMHCLCIWEHNLVGLMTGDGLDAKDKMDLMILCGLKQIACYLCFFGLHAAHEYIKSLIEKIRNFVSAPRSLTNIQFSIFLASREAKEQHLDSHPSLSAIEKILRSHQISQKRKRNRKKNLIVADRAFWLPLGQKLTSMKMAFAELGKDSAASFIDPVNRTNPTTWVLGGLPKADCILLDDKNIPASFPFSEFGIILEYGVPNKSSTLLSLAPNLKGFPPLHFLCVKVDVEDPLAALVEDNPTDQELEATWDMVLHALKKDLQEKTSKMPIVDSLNFVPATTQLQERQENLCKHLTADSKFFLPADDELLKTVDAHNFVPAAEQRHIEEMLSKRTVLHSQHFVHELEKSGSTYSVSANVIKAPQYNLSATDLPSSVKVGSIIPGGLSNPVIVVNTGSLRKNMIFSRRSSYQQILSLEKGGMQVVERDVDLPVDLILGASVCLVWFETKIFGSNDFTASTETSSITNFVETIATNILMSISFCFCGCIMVFEGEPYSLSVLMDSSYSLYAAAASLGMNLQLFFSHTPKSTDEIILSCIRNVNRLNKAPSPDIPESESLAESFLTKFPSINPLSAYIILSCGGSLVEFLGWSHERRIQAVEKYLLSLQSISLFNALCKFGELGESKSVMTGCSSVDSDICSALLQSPRERKKCASQAFVLVPTSDRLHPDPQNRLPGNYVEHGNVFSHSKFRRCSDVEDAMPQFPEVFMLDQSLSSRGEGVSCLSREHDVDALTGNQIMSDHFSNSLTTDMRHYDRRASSMVDTYDFSWQPKSGGKEPIKSSFPASSPSFSHPVFPTALEINDDTGDWDIPEPIKSSFPASSPSFSHPVFPTALEINDDTGDWDIPGGTYHMWKGGDIASNLLQR